MIFNEGTIKTYSFSPDFITFATKILRKGIFLVTI